jgi:hypothetical protein
MVGAVPGSTTGCSLTCKLLLLLDVGLLIGREGGSLKGVESLQELTL